MAMSLQSSPKGMVNKVHPQRLQKYFSFTFPFIVLLEIVKQLTRLSGSWRAKWDEK